MSSSPQPPDASERLTAEASISAPVGDGDGRVGFPRPFGPYLLLHPLARGGMGNVFLAKTGGSMGIEKHCVVKTLRARFLGDREYVQRFMDEARVVVQLTHRNICPVFDVGRVGDSHYLAMELVVGRDVRSILDALQSAGRRLPPAAALHVACEMLDALDYAHRHVDPVTGTPLHLVHRDVSPQNVMVNVEGEIKLIDFGLAESQRVAGFDSEPSTSNVVMGKIAYMAPEHARGDAVDDRADQFSAAIVVYELLAGRRYYEGFTQRQVWERAGIASHRPDLALFGPRLASVLARALSPESHQRYASCADFREDLLAFGRSAELHGGARELRSIVQNMYADDVRDLRALLSKFAGVKRESFSASVAPTTALTALSEDTLAAPDDTAFSIARGGFSAIAEPTEMLTRTTGFAESHPLPVPAPKRRTMAAGVGVLLAVVAALGVWAFQRSSAPPAPSVAIVTEAPPVVAPAPAAPVVLPAANEAKVAVAGAKEAANPEGEAARKPVARDGRRSKHPSKKPAKRRSFDALAIDEKVEAMAGCPVACAQSLARRGANIKTMTAEATGAWMSEARVCFRKCP